MRQVYSIYRRAKGALVEGYLNVKPGTVDLGMFSHIYGNLLTTMGVVIANCDLITDEKDPAIRQLDELQDKFRVSENRFNVSLSCLAKYFRLLLTYPDFAMRELSLESMPGDVNCVRYIDAAWKRLEPSN